MGKAHASESTYTCYWTQCTTSNGKITGCWHYGNGNRERMISHALQLADKSGNLFFTECTKDSNPTAVDWNRKITGLPFPD